MNMIIMMKLCADFGELGTRATCSTKKAQKLETSEFAMAAQHRNRVFSKRRWKGY